MTFFYDLNKRLAALASKQDAKQISEDAQAVAPKSRLAESMEESAFQAAIGKKKYGEKGMKALQKAGRDHASDKTMSTIRNKYDKYDESITDEGNAFTGALKATPKGGKFKVGGKEFTDTSSLEEVGMTPKQKSFAKLAPPANKITFADKIAGAKKEVDEMLGDVAAEAIKGALGGKKKEPRSAGTAFDPAVARKMFNKDEHSRHDVKDTGYSKRYTRKAEPEAEVDADSAPRGRGRPKGAPKGPERVTKGSYKFKSGRPANVAEDDIEITDRGEYDQEGKSAKCDIKTIVRHAQALHKILGNNDNLPEWVQSKLAKIEGMMTSVDDYMQSQDNETEQEPIAEKAKSQAQQKFMGMVRATQKGDKASSKEVGKVAKSMGKKDVKDFAATKHKGLPAKVKAESTDKEDQHAERAGKKVAKDIEYDEGHKAKDDNRAEKAGKKVTKDIEYDDKKDKVKETATATEPKAAKGGYNFGGGVYEGFNKRVESMITEGMSVNISIDEQGKKSISVNATDADAEALAQLLKMAGLEGGAAQATCPTCGSAQCGCDAEMVDENSPDWPTNTETSDNALQYSGGLNGPKSTGQTTVPVVASQLRRQVSMEENVKLEKSLFQLYKDMSGK